MVLFGVDGLYLYCIGWGQTILQPSSELVFMLHNCYNLLTVPSILRFALCGVGGVLLLCSLIVLACIDQDDARHSFGHSGGMFGSIFKMLMRLIQVRHSIDDAKQEEYSLSKSFSGRWMNSLNMTAIVRSATIFFVSNVIFPWKLPRYIYLSSSFTKLNRFLYACNKQEASLTR